MALKAVHVSDVPSLDHVPENAASLSLYSPSRFLKAGGLETGRSAFKAPKFLVIGHRGNGMNLLQSSDGRMKAIKENSILSFNAASNYPIDYVEFDVQVTGDGFPIIFHDNFILSEQNGMIYERRVTDLSLSEFLGYGPQREDGKVGRSLLRKTKDGRIVSWSVETDDSLCTLEEAFHKVNPRSGFNVELKFDDHVVYQEDQLVQVLQAILRVVFEHARDRPIIFSSFQPDAALLIRKLQSTYPVFFLTNAGTEIYYDVRRNSLEEAVKLCSEGGLQGIVSEVKGIFRNPGAVNKIKDSKLSLLTYGKLNNVPEAVYLQYLMGIEGVIVDVVEKITEAVSNLMRPSKEGAEEEEEAVVEEHNDQSLQHAKPEFSQKELSFLLKLIPELIQQ
ncbi:glycerophosphodiester phosphodiesterase GDPD1, chloroplastic-like isoform X1 [Coffea eugenioides]|uniref:glycerophosphodiester phosphodiesterase GDPD1, chloroplastic-like isoform X1 n=1 Tax=Coffea eugenioides TaxID=49369 RepID=UPI000F610A00|nr:glycerophosphodiester phosphodiesterase GDPD1, chloroplastic-like isoform X1 [Coffea eugenioides]XP_027155348.1 glycerophosphodiester phosphodiesterase GDPD1, chloroplastic-like isoform X1 [Coffea eugenioides]